MASVAALVESTLRERATEYLVRAGEVLVADGRVTLEVIEPLLVIGVVDDADVAMTTYLTIEDGVMTTRCDCPGGANGALCPHTVAAAIEVWQRAPQG